MKPIIDVDTKRKLAKGFSEVINKCNAENGSDTSDRILGEFLVECLAAFNVATCDRETQRSS